VENSKEKNIDSKGVLGPAKAFTKMVDEALLAKAEADKKGPGYNPLRPSSSGYCARKLAYDYSAFKGYSEKIHEDRKPAIIRLLNLGHTIEYQALKELDMIPGFSVKFKQQIVEMFKLPSGQRIEGSVDALMVSDDHKVLLDVKSVGLRWHSAFGNSWNALMEKYDRLSTMQQFDDNAWYIDDVIAWLDEIGEDALVANVTQVNLYACSPFMRDRGVEVGVIYRYCKSNSETMEIRFKTSPALFDRVKSKYSLIEEKVEARAPEAVPKEFVLGSQACAFCPYKARCWPEVDAKKAYFKTFPKKEWPEAIANLDSAPELTKLFGQLAQHELAVDQKANVEQAILKMMIESEVEKIKLADGSIYKRVYLRSPKPHFELRRSYE
jgi:hypothetical protein